MDSIVCLSASGLAYCSEVLRHGHNECLDQLGWDSPPAHFQNLTEAIPLLLSHKVVDVFWKVFVHASFESKPEVFNRIEVRRVGLPFNAVDLVFLMKCFHLI
jgi:hypothetical protein